jgi:hypothetical protein
MFQQVVNRTLQYVCGFLEMSDGEIAVMTKQRTDFACLMIMVYAKIAMLRSLYLSANCATTILLFKHPVIVMDSDAILLEKNVMAARPFALFGLSISRTGLTSMIFAVLSRVVATFRNLSTWLAGIGKPVTFGPVCGELGFSFDGFTGVAIFHLYRKTPNTALFPTVSPRLWLVGEAAPRVAHKT